MADSQQGPLDKMYRDTNIVVLIIFSICCGLIALVLNLVAFFTAKDSKAKSNAQIALIVSVVSAAAGVILGIINAMAGAGAAAIRAGAGN
ncbi:MAG: hypothetical protein U0798_06100 [Gemmataceae bacterium]